MNARIGKEIVVRITNDIGILNDICKLVAEKGIDLLAVQGTVAGDLGIIRLVTTDNLRVCDALRANNYAPTEFDCVMIDVPHKPGMLRTLAEKLAMDSIDILHLYVTGTPHVSRCLVILNTNQNDRAVVVLNH